MRTLISLLIAALLLLVPAPTASGTTTPPHWSAPVARLLADMGVLDRLPPEPDAPLDGSIWARWLCRALAWPGAGACDAAPPAGTLLLRVEALAAALPHAPARYHEPALPPAAAAHPRAATLRDAIAAGLLRGHPGGDLAPDRPLTVAEGLTVLGRLLVNRLEGTAWSLEPDRQRPPDRLRLLLHPDLVGPHRYLGAVLTDGRPVATRVRVAESAVARKVGAESGLGDGLLLLDTSAIHTGWGPVPLDVVFLDRSGLILGVFPGLPRGVIRGAPGADSALELPDGSIVALGLAAGQRLRFAPAP